MIRFECLFSFNISKTCTSDINFRALATDASSIGVDGVPFQSMDYINPIKCFVSYQLIHTQSRWYSTEREAFAIYKCYRGGGLDCDRFKVFDLSVHKSPALVSVLVGDNARGCVARWQMRMSEFDIQYHYALGREMSVAGRLSRFNRISR